MEEQTLPTDKEKYSQLKKQVTPLKSQIEDNTEQGLAETHQLLSQQFEEGTVDQLIDP